MAIFVPGSRRGEWQKKLKFASIREEFGAKSGILCSSGPSGEFLVDSLTAYQLLVYTGPSMTCLTIFFYKMSAMDRVTAS